MAPESGRSQCQAALQPSPPRCSSYARRSSRRSDRCDDLHTRTGRQLMSHNIGVSRWLDDTFKISVTLKGIDGALEAAGGAALVFVRPAMLSHLARWATQHELSQDPHDFVARHLLRYGTHLGHGSATFPAAYLLSHGLAKLELVVALLQD